MQSDPLHCEGEMGFESEGNEGTSLPPLDGDGNLTRGSLMTTPPEIAAAASAEVMSSHCPPPIAGNRPADETIIQAARKMRRLHGPSTRSIAPAALASSASESFDVATSTVANDTRWMAHLKTLMDTLTEASTRFEERFDSPGDGSLSRDPPNRSATIADFTHDIARVEKLIRASKESIEVNQHILATFAYPAAQEKCRLQRAEIDSTRETSLTFLSNWRDSALDFNNRFNAEGADFATRGIEVQAQYDEKSRTIEATYLAASTKHAIEEAASLNSHPRSVPLSLVSLMSNPAAPPPIHLLRLRLLTDQVGTTLTNVYHRTRLGNLAPADSSLIAGKAIDESNNIHKLGQDSIAQWLSESKDALGISVQVQCAIPKMIASMKKSRTSVPEWMQAMVASHTQAEPGSCRCLQLLDNH
jgi:hypothetical protein